MHTRRKLEMEPYSMAQLYITIKVHKGDDYPVRPIIEAPSVMGAALEEWMLIKLIEMPRTP